MDRKMRLETCVQPLSKVQSFRNMIMLPQPVQHPKHVGVDFASIRKEQENWFTMNRIIIRRPALSRKSARSVEIHLEIP